MQNDPFLAGDPDKLAMFVQEYVRRDGQDGAGAAAIIAAQLRDPRWLPHQMAEQLLENPAMQAAIKAVRAVHKPRDMAEVSFDTIMMDTEVLFQEAKDARQFTAALGVKKLQAELIGLLNKTIDLNVRHSISTMTDAELEALARKKVIDGEFTDVTNAVATMVASEKNDDQ
jgi:hypothetical protein